MIFNDMKPNFEKKIVKYMKLGENEAGNKEERGVEKEEKRVEWEKHVLEINSLKQYKNWLFGERKRQSVKWW